MDPPDKWLAIVENGLPAAGEPGDDRSPRLSVYLVFCYVKMKSRCDYNRMTLVTNSPAESAVAPKKLDRIRLSVLQKTVLVPSTRIRESLGVLLDR
jgi:hypothetical protein